MFDGISLGLTGIVGFAVLLMAGTVLLGQGRPADSSTVWALVVVYGPAWVIQALSFASRVAAAPPGPAAADAGAA
jgi:hypothetical protein